MERFDFDIKNNKLFKRITQYESRTLLLVYDVVKDIFMSCNDVYRQFD